MACSSSGSAASPLLVVWLAVAWGLASVAEAESIRRIAADEELVATVGPSRPTRRGAAGRILIARVVTLLPVILAIGVGGVRIVMVTYRELTVPSDTAVPIAIRVVGGATDAVVGIIVAWFVAELVGALAARRIVLGDAGVLRALGGAIRGAVRHPVRVLVGSLVPTAALVVVLVVLVVAAGPHLGRRSGRPWATAVRTSWRRSSWPSPSPCGWPVWCSSGSSAPGAVRSGRSRWPGRSGESLRPDRGSWKSAATSGTLSDLRPPEAGSDRGAS